MMKKGRIILALLCALCLPAAAHGSESSLRDIRTVIGRIEQGSIAMMGEFWLVPEDCTGFELRYRPDLSDSYMEEILPGLPAPEADESTGMLRCFPDEDTVRGLLENSYAASIGPNREILWFLSGSRPAIFIQRGKTLVLMAQSSARGVPDTDGSLGNILEYKTKTSFDPVEGEVVWSPDGRYVFFNDTERWRGGQIMLNDPYLLDTQTGDIFLIDNGGSPKDPLRGTFRCVLNGSFSADGKNFYWYCRSYADGAPSAHFLMRYNLESGEQKTVTELKGPLLDFCEISQNRWFLLENVGTGILLVRMTFSANGVEKMGEQLPAFCASAGFLPAVRKNVLLAVTPNPSGGTYLLPLTWDRPAALTSWRKIGSLEEDGLWEISAEEIEAELQEAKNNKSVLSGSGNVGTAYIKNAAAITGVTDLLLTVFIREPVPESWGGGFDDFSGQVIMNTETLKLYPIRTGSALDGLRDSLIDGTCFLLRNYGQEAIGLYSLNTFPEISFLAGETYISPYGTFMCRNESDPLVLTSVTLENHECTADVAVGEDGYIIRFHVADWPEPETVRQEYIVPEVLSADRWNEITSALSNKDRKKFLNLYMKSTPEKLAEKSNADEILACYPAAATETLYILNTGLKAFNLETEEELLKSIGYTAEDFERDMELAAVRRETNVIVTKNGKNRTAVVRYSFSFSDSLRPEDGGRILELAGLCERIGKALMANRLSADPLPVESVILDKYDMGSIDFYVTVDLTETTESTLDLTLAVHP